MIPSELIPGAVNSPVRAFGGVGSKIKPPLIASGRGAVVYTEDGRALVDYVHGWGSIIAGHTHPDVMAAVSTQCTKGIGFGMTTNLEYEYAAILRERVGLDMFRAVNSGTEATMTALRLARGYTGRDLIVKFAGCYHGHVDSMLVAAGSGALTFGHPSSAGVTQQTVADTLVLPYNDPTMLRECFAKHGDKIAGVIFEPVAGNMNLIIPDSEFIDELAACCNQSGALIIADEVMTGLRATQSLVIRDRYRVEPDLVCLGKVIGGGLPAAAVAGRSKIMSLLAPTGPVYQAGTLAGNPLALTAAIATINLLTPEAHTRLSEAAARLCTVLTTAAAAAKIKLCAQNIGAMAGYYLLEKLPRKLFDVQQISQHQYEIFYQHMLAEGVLLPPSKFEACFVGLAHDDDAFKVTETAAIAACHAVAQLAE